MAVAHRIGEGRAAPAVARVHLGPVLDEVLYDTPAAFGRRQVQRRTTVVVRPIEIVAATAERAQLLEIADARRVNRLVGLAGRRLMADAARIRFPGFHETVVIVEAELFDKPLQKLNAAHTVTAGVQSR